MSSFFTSHTHFLFFIFNNTTSSPPGPLLVFSVCRCRTKCWCVCFGFGAEWGLGSIEHVSRRVENKVLGIGDLG